MKKNAIFVNVSRGGVVNQEDLCTALRQNIIYAAGKVIFCVSKKVNCTELLNAIYNIRTRRYYT